MDSTLHDILNGLPAERGMQYDSLNRNRSTLLN